MSKDKNIKIPENEEHYGIDLTLNMLAIIEIYFGNTFSGDNLDIYGET